MFKPWSILSTSVIIATALTTISLKQASADTITGAAAVADNKTQTVTTSITTDATMVLTATDVNRHQNVATVTSKVPDKASDTKNDVSATTARDKSQKQEIVQTPDKQTSAGNDIPTDTQVSHPVAHDDISATETTDTDKTSESASAGKVVINQETHEHTKSLQGATLTSFQNQRIFRASKIQARSGWVNDNGQRKYQENGHFISGEKKIDNYWYNFDNNYVMSRGLTQLPNKIVYYNAQTGRMVYGYLWYNNDFMYFDDYDGHMIKGERHYGNNSMEYYDNSGMQVRDAYVWAGNTFYYMKPNGDAVKGVRYYGNGNMEFYGDDFKQVRNNYAQDAAGRYYLTSNGDAFKGVRNVGNSFEIYGNDYKQVINQYVATGSTFYYMDQNGLAIKGIRHYGNTNMEYYGSDAKQVRDAYVHDNGVLYYMKSNGDALRGFRHYGNNMLEYYGDNFVQYRDKYLIYGHKRYHFGRWGDADTIDTVDANGNVVAVSKFNVWDTAYITKFADSTLGGSHDLKQLAGQNVTILNKTQTNYSNSSYYYTVRLANNNIISHVLEQDLQSSPVQFHVDVNQVINWFEYNKGRLTYSMYGSRNGADGTADCSGSMTQALYEAGAKPYDYLYSTESLHDYLTNNGFKLIIENASSWDAKRGDIVIWGKRGFSEGAFGHVGIMTTTENDPYFISTCYLTAGAKGSAVQEVRYNEFAQRDSYPYYYVYRQM